MFIIGTANITLWFLATQQVPEKVASFFLSISHNPYVLMLIVNILLLITGCLWKPEQHHSLRAHSGSHPDQRGVSPSSCRVCLRL
jgi:hypothetical protein